MKFQAIALLLVAATSAIAQAVTDSIAPSAPAPPGCTPSFDGKFEIHIKQLNPPKEVAPVQKVSLLLPLSRPAPRGLKASPSLTVDLSLTTVSLRLRDAP